MKKFLGFYLILLLLGVFSGNVSALSGDQFQAGRIIDDAIFFNGSSMNAGDIQNFLNAKLPTCETNHARSSSGNDSGPPYTCMKDYRQDTFSIAGDAYCNGFSPGNKSAAQIIQEVGASCGVSQKVILITLQKEQSLVTDTWPWTIQYTKATGYGCPDSALPGDVDANQNGCYDEFEGFFKQVYYGARQFKRYAKDSQIFTNYRAGRTNYIQYHPDASCGGTNVYIENQATSGLYIYTPYQPNAAALNDLYGSGDIANPAPPNCSSFGNRNFWRLFNDWFGQSVYITPLLGYAPAVVAQNSEKINVFSRGQDFRLWQTWYDNGTWYPGWNYIDGQSPASSAASAISWGSGHMDVFETRNGELWHSWYNADSIGWRGWSSLGRPNGVWLGGSPAAVVQQAGKINVFARGHDGRLWQTWYENGNWHSWNYIDGPSPDSSSPSAISWQNGHMDVFEIRKGVLWHSWYNADSIGWRGWSPLGNPASAGLIASPAVIDQAYGKINVFARGTDRRLWQTWYENGNWQSQWNTLDGPSPDSSAPTAISLRDGHMDIFEARNGQLWHSWYNADPTGWRWWSPLGRP